MLWDSIPVPKGTDADFAVAVTDDSLAPWIKKGGTVYLFAVNRAHAEDDRMIPPDKAAELVCYGRLELKKPIPLPMD